MKTIVWITVLLCSFSNHIFGQITDEIREDRQQENQLKVKYKQVDTVDLYLYIYYPPNYNKRKKYPAILFYFGGGWKWGNYKQFEPHARYFADRGIIGILVDYRVKNKHKTSIYVLILSFLFFMVFSYLRNKQIRHAIIMLPYIALISAKGISSLRKNLAFVFVKKYYYYSF